MCEVVKLAKHVAWGAAGNAREWPEPPQVRPVAQAALYRLPRAAFVHQRFAFRQAPYRHICGERRAGVATLETDEIVWKFDDALAERLAFTALRRCPHKTRDVAFRRGVALDHLDALSRPQGREIGGRRFHLGIG